ncbi:MAG: cadherin-like beta sandwich domain-containing protein [Oscillospiraceae bacterium]|nr:cadherin-like beta sandwich domain-containing protein [Oscillospiraceae bacterium]
MPATTGRITSLNILLEQEGHDYLSELYGRVIENVQKELISADMKNRELSGDPTSGSVEAKRFANASPKAYGTARAAGKGDALRARPVTVPLDQDDEIVEEIEEKDIRLYGVDGLLERRAANHVQRMAANLDRAFFTAAYNGATEAEINSNDPIEDQLEAIIQTCENTMNNFVDGVPRAMMRLVCGTYVYGKIRNALDKTARTNVDTTTEEFYAWHGVEVKSCVHLPAGCPFLLITEGSVAQPVYAIPYSAEKIPLSTAYAVELFYHYGTTVVTPDLIFKPKYVTAASGNSGSGTVTTNAKLSALSLGSLTLSPTFDADTTAYTAATTNATNTVTATAADSNATVAITNGSTTVANGSAATWSDGENTLTITVTSGAATKTYTVTVMKS